ncbi:MAG: hypothetical protein OSA99_11900, partial [Acidimicrobiales bacterium]|nr:hypothetical protein [Acidimicrobiales bacterium]
MDDHRSTEHARSRIEVAQGDGLANGGTRDRAATLADGPDNLDIQTNGLQALGCALAVAAEFAIEAKYEGLGG